MKILPKLYSRPRILPQDVNAELNSVIKMMKNEDKIEGGFMYFHRNCYIGNAEKPETRILAPLEFLKKDCAEILHKNREYSINPETGAVKNISSFFLRIFEPAAKTIKNISEAISVVKQNFNNPEIVQKHKIGFFVASPKASDEIDKINKSIARKSANKKSN